MEPDEDLDEINQGIEFNHQIDTGDGYGISVEVVLSDSHDMRIYGPGFNLGFLFLSTSHKETQTREDVHSHSGYLEGILHGSTTINDALALSLSLAGGLGLSSIDFPDEHNDSTSGAAEIRVGADLQFFQRLEIGITAGSYLWGYPSETVGYGSFFGTRLSFLF